jgi:hypothetical protein
MNNQPAFPSLHWVAPQGHSANENPQGMTLRDYFAARALGGLINYSPEPSEHEAIAKLCYSLADAMMKAREA